MNRNPVVSSNIRAVGYNVDEQILEIEFMNGAVYEYSHVPDDVYQDLMSARSIGAYHHENIKGRYSFRKVSG